VLQADHFGARKTRRPPHIYSAKDIDRLIETALCLRSRGGLRSLTCVTLIAQLSAARSRISEALKLTLADVSNDGQLIRKSKFRKACLVSVHDTAAASSQRHLACRRPHSDDEPVFVDARGLTLRYVAVKETFHRLIAWEGSHRRQDATFVCTICGTRSRCVHCKAARRIEA